MSLGAILGIITLSAMVLTAFFGLRTPFFKAKIRLRIHKILAIISIILALIHGAYILYNYYLI